MIEIAGGSVTGSRHQHKLNIKNNQDAFAWADVTGIDDGICAIVCDGCSGGKHSEVGAGIFAKFLACEIAGEDYRINKIGVEHLNDSVLGSILWKLETTMEDLFDPDPRIDGKDLRREVIKEYFLFTVNGVLVTEKQVIIFSIGDGVAYLNDTEIALPVYPNNAPPYLAYELIQDKIKGFDPDDYKFKIHEQIPVEKFKHCLIGSDGVKDLENVSEFWEDDRYFQNPDQIRRRLALINKRTHEDGKEQLGPLPDDTTLIVIRRNNES